jgi:uncharacterized protein YjbI with pentapeptide repeats
MSEQNETQATILQRPTTDDEETWKAYWKAQGQPWRTEPEIDVERQKYLSERRSITPNTEQGIYPFKSIKLTRADMEWLLATHENGRGPVDWSNKSQRQCQGLDLRGADLRRANLRGLPMACLCAGLAWYKKNFHTSEQLDYTGVCLERADLRETHLEGATLRGAHLEHANLREAFLEEADLSRAHLEGANLREAHLNGTKFIRTHLEWADLPDAHLEEAKLIRAHLEGAHLRGAHLEGADLRRAFLDIATNLDGTLISNMKGESILLAGIHWGGVDLTMLNWGQVKVLGDEYLVRQNKRSNEERIDKITLLAEYEEAVRANRQLAVALRDQGLNEEADRFAYRAQLLQRKVLWRQRKFGHWLFSMLLALLSGYGYRIWRILAAYIVVVFLFALAYFVLGLHYPPQLPLVQAFLESITAFHGRVFLEQFSPTTPQIWLTAFEAIAGLVIEGVFIAMLIQRFFGK